MNAHTTITRAHSEWASRPDDQRFTSLDDLLAFTTRQKQISHQSVLSNRKLRAAPVDDGTHRNLTVEVLGTDQRVAVPTHWAFDQLAERVKAPAGYLRTLPTPMVCDLLNYGLFARDVEDVGVLTRGEGDQHELAAATGPRYGRVWNADVARALKERFGDGVTGDFTVPGEFGQAVEVDKGNTTIYASDRDMFVFLADEKNRVEVPQRRNGQAGSLARGFFVWNSEVGSKTLGMATFLFDYACSNRIVWGAQGYEEHRIMHFASADDRWREQMMPAIEAYARKSNDGISTAIEAARKSRVEGDALDQFLRNRFTLQQSEAIKQVHLIEEDRPIETLWDVTTGITAYARSVKHQDARVALERKAGAVMALAS